MDLFISNFNSLIYQTIINLNLINVPQVTLIYGPQGLGKTTLLNLLYQQMRKKEIMVEIINSRIFAQEYAYAAQENSLPAFRERFRSPELLLLDDLQLLVRKPKTQVELLYTYEHLIERGGKIVIVLESDFPALNFLEKGLASRFLGGLTLTIKQLSDDEMEEFIDYYLDNRHLIMEREAIHSLARRVSNLEMVISSVNKFVDYAEIRQAALTQECFEEFWSNLEDNNSLELEPFNVLRVTAEVMGITVEDILGFKRTTKISEARQLAVYAIRILCHNKSYPEIGRIFTRGHGAIIRTCQQLEKRITFDNGLKQRLEMIINYFGVLPNK